MFLFYFVGVLPSTGYLKNTDVKLNNKGQVIVDKVYNIPSYQDRMPIYYRKVKQPPINTEITIMGLCNL